ncbi:hypothetical protein TSUD_369580 [Trifolium subterraneum]|uniref:Uncharacterized protein n=1 Tax=Trifolium subterraneum TaxID=3900 RepID=A0A2Z6P231_TRISU|nr:hypothetical protein TSUD_369580 [Trifolium subterraneum]
MVKFHFGNLGCEKGWSQIHSRYGTYQHAHYHFRKLWSITMGTSSENAAGGSRGIAVPKEVDYANYFCIYSFSTIKKRCSHIVFKWMLTSMSFFKTDIALRIRSFFFFS